MMKPAQRSAMWPPSTTQSATDDAPYFGTQNRIAGDTYSIASAIAHSTSRGFPCANPPEIQNTADTESHARMRHALRRVVVWPGAVDASRKIVRPTCIAL